MKSIFIILIISFTSVYGQDTLYHNPVLNCDVGARMAKLDSIIKSLSARRKGCRWVDSCGYYVCVPVTKRVKKRIKR